MKSLRLALCALGTFLVSSQAVAGITVLGNGSAAVTCYQSAEARARTAMAIAQCSTALNDDMLNVDDRVATLINRGIVLMLADRTSEAVRDFDHAITIDANQPEAYLNKGLTQFRLGDSVGAQALASRALELRTRKPAIAYYVRALAAEDRGDVRSAYADLRRAAAIEPGWSEPATELQRYRVRR